MFYFISVLILFCVKILSQTQRRWSEIVFAITAGKYQYIITYSFGLKLICEEENNSKIILSINISVDIKGRRKGET